MTGALTAGEPIMAPAPSVDAFARAIRPISNPTLFDLAKPQTNLHGIFMYQNHPDMINTTAGQVPVGGDVQLYALQLEYAFNERISLVATKDGYADFNPDHTLNQARGWANLAAGVKYAFIYDEANEHILSGTATIEVPTGDDDIFQGNGNGAVNLILNDLKLWGPWQFSGSIGARLPFDGDENSTSGFLSTHVSYAVTEKFIPLIELSWFHVFSAGDGSADFGNRQGNDLVPSIVEFEGGDLWNLGAANATNNRDQVTLALGARYLVTDRLNVGAAYELPLTDEEDGLLEDRFTLDVIWNF